MNVTGPSPELLELFREAQRQQAALLAVLEKLTSPALLVAVPEDWTKP